MPLAHKHLIMDITTNYAPTDEWETEVLMFDLINLLKMNIAPIPSNPITWYCETKGNRGMTAVAIITTSHIALHSWDESPSSPRISICVYSCKDFNPSEVIEFFNKKFGIKTINYKFIDRDGDYANTSGDQDYIINHYKN